MTEKSIPTEILEARDLLEAAHASEYSIMKRVAAPIGVSIVIAILFGGIVAATSSGATELVGLFVAALAALIIAHQRNLPFVPRALPRRPAEFLAMIVFILGLLLVIAVGRVARDAYGVDWAPLGAGGFAAIIIFSLAFTERLQASKKADAEYPS